jgi:CheY-like chemotaxis protein
MSNAQKPVILLADDSADDIAFFRSAVAQANLDISLYTVSDGRQAASYLQGEGDYHDRDRYPFPDLIVTNGRMPNMNGIELLRWVKQQPQFQQIPMVMLSGSDQFNRSDQALQSGAVAFFDKPPNVDGWVTVVTEIINFIQP